MQRATITITLLATALLVLVTSSILYLPTFILERDASNLSGLTEPEMVAAKNAIRATLLQGIGGLLILIGAGVSLRQLHANRDAQTTTYLSHAVDQIGDTDVNVRTGGIYALGRIAKTSREDRDAIAYILVTFLRNRCPWPPPNSSPFPDGSELSELPPLRVRASDAQAALDVLGKGLARVHYTISAHGKVYQQRLSLIHIDLRRSRFGGADFGSANFVDCCLDGALFEGAKLDRAWMERTSLKEASFTGLSSDLTSIHVRHSNLEGIRFYGTNLRYSSFLEVNLAAADFQEAYLRGSDLEDVDFGEAQSDERTVWPRSFSPTTAGIRIGTKQQSASAWSKVRAWMKFNALYTAFGTNDDAQHIN
jgi:uncharacterized protein YjbI with pentapeptide repeats